MRLPPGGRSRSRTAASWRDRVRLAGSRRRRRPRGATRFADAAEAPQADASARNFRPRAPPRRGAPLSVARRQAHAEQRDVVVQGAARALEGVLLDLLEQPDEAELARTRANRLQPSLAQLFAGPP